MKSVHYFERDVGLKGFFIGNSRKVNKSVISYLVVFNKSVEKVDTSGNSVIVR